MTSESYEKALKYHSQYPVGKISTVVTKPAETQEDLSLAYSPGVAGPCLAIKTNPDDSYTYTWRTNTIAVVSDGSAVLGLGDIGAYAAMPVMEGKALLFKKFAGIDGIPLCLDKTCDERGNTCVNALVETIERLEPSFGGINLEDIKAPYCFEVEKILREKMQIPVLHDDQHGTAVIVLAALYNALELAQKKIDDITIVINGAGAAGIATAHFLLQAGVSRLNLFVCDSLGIIYQGRDSGMNEYKEAIAVETHKKTLDDALRGADVFIGVSQGNILHKAMVQTMAQDPIIFALANPVPEISYEQAKKAGAFIVGTGRSDFPNQVNNVLGFPGIFRGALDCRARRITESMKVAVSKALASLAREPFPDDIKNILLHAYPNEEQLFESAMPLGTDYVIPKPLDPRVVPRVARYVVEQAMKEGVARIMIEDLDAYEKQVRERVIS